MAQAKTEWRACLTTACKRRPPVSARPSLPLPGAPDAQRSASMERRRSASDRLEETTMWYRTVGCLVTLVLSLIVAPRTATAQKLMTLPRIGVRSAASPPPPSSPTIHAFRQGLRARGYVEG